MEMFLAVVLSIVAADAPSLSNPGFEQINDQTGLPQGWSFTFLPDEPRLVRYETTTGDGAESRALLITLAKDHPAKKVAYSAVQEVPAGVAGKTYRISAKVRSRGLHNLPVIFARCVDQPNTNLLAFARSPQRAINSDIEQWERIATSITIPAGATTMLLLVGIPSEGNAGGTAIIDDIEIIEEP